MCAGQQRFEFWNEEDEGAGHDRGTECREQGRVDHGSQDLGPEFVEAFEELRKTAQDVLQKRGSLAGLDHRGMEWRKHLRKLAQGVGESLAIRNCGPDLLEDGLELTMDRGTDE